MFLVALVGLVVLWHLANPEMQRQARIQLIYGMDDVCTVGCTFGWRKYLRSRWTVWPWHSNISGETLQKNKTEMCGSAAGTCFCEITEDFLDERVAGSCQKWGEEGLLHFMGGGTED